MAINEVLPTRPNGVDEDGDVHHVDDLGYPDALGAPVDDEERFADEISAETSFGVYFANGEFPKAVFPITLEGRYSAVDLLERGIALSALMYYFNSRNAAVGARIQREEAGSAINTRYKDKASDVVDAMSGKSESAGGEAKNALNALIDASTLAEHGLSPGQIARERAALLDHMNASIGRPGHSKERQSLAKRAMDLGRLTHRKYRFAKK